MGEIILPTRNNIHLYYQQWDGTCELQKWQLLASFIHSDSLVNSEMFILMPQKYRLLYLGLALAIRRSSFGPEKFKGAKDLHHGEDI